MYYIRVIRLWCEQKFGDFRSIPEAQEFLSKCGYERVGESGLFWKLDMRAGNHSYTAEITKFPETKSIDMFPRKINDWFIS